ncbi:hypothetical protein Q1695_001625 [Nippostrongylus brasiliensis]|nr:hypothetical protein Q1695_001625 [Nippostrongylus brasiliensis]
MAFTSDKLYDRISQLNCRPVVLEKEASAISRDVVSHIETAFESTSETLELQQLLQSNSMESCLQAHDIVISEVYDDHYGRNAQAAASASSQIYLIFLLLNTARSTYPVVVSNVTD